MGHNFHFLNSLGWLTAHQWRKKRKLFSIHPSIHLTNSPSPSGFFLFKSCNFGYDCPSWAMTRVEMKPLAGVRLGRTLLGGGLLPGCLVEGDSRIREAKVSFPKLEVSLWLVPHHQKKNYRMSPEIKKGIDIPPHVTAYKSMFPNLFFCFYSNKRGCNSCRNQVFWFYQLVALFSHQYPDLNNYPSILELLCYSDNSVMLNIECMLFSYFPLI